MNKIHHHSLYPSRLQAGQGKEQQNCVYHIWYCRRRNLMVVCKLGNVDCSFSSHAVSLKIVHMNNKGGKSLLSFSWKGFIRALQYPVSNGKNENQRMPKIFSKSSQNIPCFTFLHLTHIVLFASFQSQACISWSLSAQVVVNAFLSGRNTHKYQI